MDPSEFTPALTDRLFTQLAGARATSLAGLLGTAFGTGPRGGVDTAHAARTLGVSARTVRRWLAGGQPSDPARVQARAMAAAAFGTGPRGGVNVATAATALGVSRSTVYRWLSGQIPAAQAQRLASAAHDRVIASTAGRAAIAHTQRAQIKARMAIDPATGQKRPYPQQRMFLRVVGTQNVDSGPRSALTRRRTVHIPFTPEHVDGLLGAWEEGGDPAAVNYIENAASALYMGWAEDATPQELADPDYPGKGWWMRAVDDVSWTDDAS